MTQTAQLLKGDCWISGPKPAGDPFPVISMDIMFSTKSPFLGDGFPTATGYRPRLCDPTDATKNLIIPCSKLRGHPNIDGIPQWTKKPYSILWGKSSIEEFVDPTWYFDFTELSAWNPVTIPNPDYFENPLGIVPEFYDVAGPKFSYASCFQRLYKRNQTLYPLRNLDNVQWQYATAGDNTLEYERRWLANLMPASPLWCNPIDQPLLGEEYYENAHYDGPAPSFDKTQTAYKANFIPFCNPMNVRNKLGVLLGQFDGLGFQGFFNYAGVLSPQIPEYDYSYIDSGALEPPYPYLVTSKQFLSFELWIYLSGVGIKSPRIAQMRWWWYTDYLDGAGSGEPVNSTNTPFNPYLFFNCPFENMYIEIKCNLYDETTKLMRIPLHQLQVAVRA